MWSAPRTDPTLMSVPQIARGSPNREGRLIGRYAEQRAYAGEQVARGSALDQRGQIVLRPLPDVVFQKMREHRFVTLAALGQRHLQRALQRRRDRVGLVRIDDQC